MAKTIDLVCSRVPPAPVYKGGEGKAGRPCRARQEKGVLLGLQVLVGFHLVEGGRRKGEGEGKERGAPHPSPSTIRTQGGGAAPAPCGPSLSSLRPMKAH